MRRLKGSCRLLVVTVGYSPPANIPVAAGVIAVALLELARVAPVRCARVRMRAIERVVDRAATLIEATRKTIRETALVDRMTAVPDEILVMRVATRRDPPGCIVVIRAPDTDMKARLPARTARPLPVHCAANRFTREVLRAPARIRPTGVEPDVVQDTIRSATPEKDIVDRIDLVLIRRRAPLERVRVGLKVPKRRARQCRTSNCQDTGEYEARPLHLPNSRVLSHRLVVADLPPAETERERHKNAKATASSG